VGGCSKSADASVGNSAAGLPNNKLYETETLAGILEAQYRDDYGTLLRHASDAVRKWWRLHEWRRRQDHDPVWLASR
jgi:hypothetical protein